MKKSLVFLGSLLAIGALAGCNQTTPHEHTFKTEFTHDETNHWHEASCEHTDLISGLEAHNFGDDNVCGDCGYVKPTPEIAHEHTFASGWTNDETNHWHQATCEHITLTSGLAVHNYGGDNVCDDCDYEKPAPVIPHEHTFATDWTHDETNHWHAASCEHTELTSGLEAHNFGGDNVCDDCGYEKPTSVIPHEHTFKTEFAHDETNHWHEASCEHTDLISGLEAHNFGGDNVCNDCGYTKPTPVVPHEHSFASAWSKDETNHWHAATCEHLELTSGLEAHNFGGDNVCDDCGYVKPTPEIAHEHTFASGWTNDETNHWHQATCEHIDLTSGLTAHNYGGDNVCDDCGYTKPTPEVPHEHTFKTDFEYDETNHWHAATCEHTTLTSGLAAHNYGGDNVCDDCGYEKPTPFIPHEHTFADTWSRDDTSHWHAASCEHTELTSGLEAHNFGGDNVCDDCGYEKPAPAHVHTYDLEHWETTSTHHWHTSTCEHTGLASNVGQHSFDENGECTMCGYKKEAEHFSFSFRSDYCELDNENVYEEGDKVELSLTLVDEFKASLSLPDEIEVYSDGVLLTKGTDYTYVIEGESGKLSLVIKGNIVVSVFKDNNVSLFKISEEQFANAMDVSDQNYVQFSLNSAFYSSNMVLLQENKIEYSPDVVYRGSYSIDTSRYGGSFACGYSYIENKGGVYTEYISDNSGIWTSRESNEGEFNGNKSIQLGWYPFLTGFSFSYDTIKDHFNSVVNAYELYFTQAEYDVKFQVTFYNGKLINIHYEGVCDVDRGIFGDIALSYNETAVLVPDEAKPHEHTFSDAWSIDETNHWHAATCEHDGLTRDLSAHVFGNDNICDTCGYTKPAPAHEHSFSDDWSQDAVNHWHAATCEHSDLTKDLASHEYGEDNICDICGYEYIEKYYSVIWKNYNGDILEVDYQVKEGTTPTCETTPTKDDGGHVFNFTGWSPEVGPITENMVFTANFEQDMSQKLVIFKDDLGNELNRQLVLVGEEPDMTKFTYKGIIENNKVKVLTGWDKPLGKIYEDTTFVGSYETYDKTISASEINEVLSTASLGTNSAFDIYTYKNSSVSNIEHVSIANKKYRSVFEYFDSENIDEVYMDENYRYHYRIHDGVERAMINSYEETPLFDWDIQYSMSSFVTDADYTFDLETGLFISNGSRRKVLLKMKDGQINYIKSILDNDMDAEGNATTFEELHNLKIGGVEPFEIPEHDYEGINKYKVTFVDLSSQVINEQFVYEGALPDFSKVEVPERIDTGDRILEFKGWENIVEPVDKDVTFTAQYYVYKKTYTKDEIKVMLTAEAYGNNVSFDYSYGTETEIIWIKYIALSNGVFKEYTDIDENYSHYERYADSNYSYYLSVEYGQVEVCRKAATSNSPESRVDDWLDTFVNDADYVYDEDLDLYVSENSYKTIWLKLKDGKVCFLKYELKQVLGLYGTIEITGAGDVPSISIPAYDWQSGS